MKKSVRRHTKLTPVLFVRLYMESWAAGHTMKQFAARVGMTPNQARARVYSYRKRGWKAPPLASARQRPIGHPPLSVAALNAITAEMMPGTSEISCRPAASLVYQAADNSQW